MTYRIPLAHRYGLRRAIDPVDPRNRAYETLDGSKLIWSERSTSRGRIWSAYGADDSIWSAVRRDFATLREATAYATGTPITPTNRRSHR